MHFINFNNFYFSFTAYLVNFFAKCFYPIIN